MPPGDPRLVSLDASYRKEQEYIWFRDGNLNGFTYKIWMDLGMPLGELLSPPFLTLVMLNKFNFETILHNFRSISIISQNFKTIRPVDIRD